VIACYRTSNAFSHFLTCGRKADGGGVVGWWRWEKVVREEELLVFKQLPASAREIGARSSNSMKPSPGVQTVGALD
jgi:hypothetical protein